MRIFITGGAGFIGSYFCHWLIQRGLQVTAYDSLLLGRKEYIADLIGNPGFTFLNLDLLSDKKLAQHIKGHDLVLHLAANSDISRGGEQTDLDLNLGIIATYNVLEAMRVAHVKKIVFASTSAVYGEAQIKPTPESYGPLVPISFYGASKLACEALIAAFAHNYDYKSWIYRFANIVGPNMTHGAIYDFQKRLEQDPNKLKVLGNGHQKKSYLHVSDCVEGIWWGLEKANAEVNLFNLASQGTTNVRFIAETVVNKNGGEIEIQYGQEDRGWKGDVPYTFLDDQKLKNLGWSARMNSDQAVILAVKENYFPAGTKNG